MRNPRSNSNIFATKIGIKRDKSIARLQAKRDIQDSGYPYLVSVEHDVRNLCGLPPIIYLTNKL